MGWPATLGVGFGEFNKLAAIVKQRALQESEVLETNTTAERIISAVREMAGYRDRLDAFRSLPGMGAFALQQFGDGFDAAAESQATLDAIDVIEAWVNINFPKSAGGFLEARQFVGGTVDTTWRIFTPAQTSALKAAYDALAATIE